MTSVLVACGSESRPPDESGRARPTALSLNVVAETEPPQGAEPLADGEYGLERSGDTRVPLMTVSDVGCNGDNYLQVATNEGKYLLHLRTLPQWTCTQALEQVHKITSGNAANL